MNIMNIIDKIYENKNFTNIFLISIFLLALLFIVILLLGLRDAKKTKNPKKELKEEEVKDVTFSLPTEKEKEEIKEDVTFELPVLTDDLENFKKNLEEEIKKDEEVRVINKVANTKELEVATRPIKILDINEIEDTQALNTEEIKKSIEETKKPVEKPKKGLTKEEIFKKEDTTKQLTREQYKHIGEEKESKYNSKDRF